MPTRKDFKRLVRRRMEKTGESYTSARAHLLRPSSPSGRSATAARRDLAALAGIGDPAVRAATGRDWSQWTRLLDALGAHEWPHERIAAHLAGEFGLRPWWSQTTTVGYERIRGLRAIGQRRSGAWEVTKTRTFASRPDKVFGALRVARTRKRWLPAARPTVRAATPSRSVRLRWDDGTRVEVTLVAKTGGKTTVQVQHRGLPNRAAVDRLKRYWAERLDALAALLGTGAIRRPRV
jgi:uncharacterized protein YndB with AHSA1/START domain